MAAWYPHVKWRHWNSDEGDSLDVAPPLGVILFMPLSATWIVVALLFSFSPGLSEYQLISLALFGGVAPIAIAYGIMTNRRWTRPVILLTLLANLWLFATPTGATSLEQFRLNSAAGVALLVWGLLALYFYRRKTTRKYYLLIAGKSLPDELRGVDLSPPKALVFLLSHIAILAEWMLIVLALAIFFGVLLFSDRIG